MSLRLFLMDQLKINDLSRIEKIEYRFKIIEESAVFAENSVGIKRNELDMLKLIISQLSYISFVEKLKKVSTELYGSLEEDHREMLSEIKSMGGGYCVSIAMYKKCVQNWNNFMSMDNTRSDEGREAVSTNNAPCQLKHEICWLIYLLGKQTQDIEGSNITQSYFMMLASVVYVMEQSKIFEADVSSSLLKIEIPSINYIPLVKEVCQFSGLTSLDQINSVDNFIHVIEKVLSVFIDEVGNDSDTNPRHQIVEFLIDNKSEFEHFIFSENNQSSKHPFKFNEATLIQNHNVSCGAIGDSTWFDRGMSSELGLGRKFIDIRPPLGEHSNVFFTSAMESSMLLHLLNHMTCPRPFDALTSLLTDIPSKFSLSPLNQEDARLTPLKTNIHALLDKLQEPLLTVGNKSFAQTVLKQCECLYVHSLIEFFEETPMSDAFINNRVFNSAVLAVATEIVLKAHSLVVFSFPKALEILNISSYDFSHILVHYIDKVSILPGSMQQHLQRIHEVIMTSQVWKEESDIFNRHREEEENDKVIQLGIVVFLNGGKLRKLFFESVHKFSSEMISMLTVSFGNMLILQTSDQVVRDGVNEIMTACINDHIDMLKNRNLVHLVLCSFYAVCKVYGLSVSFNEVMQKYMELFQCEVSFFEDIPCAGEGERGDLIDFFNSVFLLNMKNELAKMSASPTVCLQKHTECVEPLALDGEDLEQRSFISSRLGTSKFRVNIRDSPSSKRNRALKVPYMRTPLMFCANSSCVMKSSALLDSDKVYSSPKKTVSSVNVYSFGKPSKDLQSINSALKRRKL